VGKWPCKVRQDLDLCNSIWTVLARHDGTCWALLVPGPVAARVLCTLFRAYQRLCRRLCTTQSSIFAICSIGSLSILCMQDQQLLYSRTSATSLSVCVPVCSRNPLLSICHDFSRVSGI
jgi:hypothetical protein